MTFAISHLYNLASIVTSLPQYSAKEGQIMGYLKKLRVNSSKHDLLIHFRMEKTLSQFWEIMYFPTMTKNVQESAKNDPNKILNNEAPYTKSFIIFRSYF